MRTLQVDGHLVGVVESVEDDGTSYLLLIDNIVINSDATLSRAPSDAMVRAAALGWQARH